jgi:hypothetical protein
MQRISVGIAQGGTRAQVVKEISPCGQSDGSRRMARIRDLYLAPAVDLCKEALDKGVNPVYTRGQRSDIR